MNAVNPRLAPSKSPSRNKASTRSYCPRSAAASAGWGTAATGDSTGAAIGETDVDAVSGSSEEGNGAGTAASLTASYTGSSTCGGAIYAGQLVLRRL